MTPEHTSFLPRLTGRTSLRLAALTALLGLAASARAANIVADPGFESAGGGNIYFAGQTIDTGSWNVTLGDIYIDTADPYVFAGNNAANLTAANPYTFNTLAETLTTTPGKIYDYSFWADADSANIFSLTENGVTIAGAPTSIVDNGFPGAITNSSLFVDYTGVFTATTSSTTLAFSDEANPPIGSALGSVMIDNVSISPTPEPSSLALMLTGVLALGLAFGVRRLGKPLSAL
jgi:hypothetical protein